MPIICAAWTNRGQIITSFYRRKMNTVDLDFQKIKIELRKAVEDVVLNNQPNFKYNLPAILPVRQCLEDILKEFGYYPDYDFIQHLSSPTSFYTIYVNPTTKKSLTVFGGEYIQGVDGEILDNYEAV